MKRILTTTLALACLAPLGCKQRAFNSLSQTTTGSPYVAAGDWYYPDTGSWSGRLVLPAFGERRPDGGVWLEVYSSPRGESAPSGRVWLSVDQSDPNAKLWMERTVTDVSFARSNGRAEVLRSQGNFIPERIDGWTRVSPLESLAGARPDAYKMNVGGTTTADSVEVVLPRARLRGNELITVRDPIQIAGREVALVRFEGPAGDGRMRVRHWGGGGFSGVEEVVRYEKSTLDAPGKIAKSTFAGIESSPLNPDGWYLFGEHLNGEFVVRAVEPRSLLDLKNDGHIAEFEQAEEFIRSGNFKDEASKKGKAFSQRIDREPGQTWNVGDRGVLLHVFGGIDGEGGDKPVVLPLSRRKMYTGHFAYGMGRVWREPITGEARFDVEYRQVYANNPDGIISGAQKWAAYMGSVERGWAWSRPVSDTIAKHPAFDRPFDLGGGLVFDALDEMQLELDIMAARFRTGDGRGVAEVTGPNSCVQDSNQALYIALQRFMDWIQNDKNATAWYQTHLGQAEVKRIDSLKRLVNFYRSNIVRLAGLRDDWREAARSPLAIERQDVGTLENILRAIESRNTLIPRFAYDDVSVVLLLNYSAQWLFHSAQIGGVLNGVHPAAPGFN